MKRSASLLVFVAACLLAWGLAQAGEEATPLDEALKRIQSEKPDERRQAFEDIRTLGDRAVPELAKRLTEPGKGDAGVRFALHGLAAYAARPGAEAERKAFAAAVAAELKGNYIPEAKRFLIGQLQIAGGAEAVPALAQCFGDKELAEAARQALMANPAPEAVAALREALPRSEGLLRVGLVDALGFRRDRDAVDLLLREAASGSEDVRKAAYHALGRIGDPRAEPVLLEAIATRKGREQRAAAEGALLLAEALAAADQKAVAARVYAGVLSRSQEAQHRCAALGGIGAIGSVDALDAVLPCVADADFIVRRAAMACMARMPDAQVAAAIAGSIDKAQPPVRAALLRVLSDRKEPQAKATLEKAMGDPSAEVRVTAAELLGKLDDPALEATLIEAAGKGSDLIHPIALAAYLRQAEARRAKGDRSTALDICHRCLDLARTDDLRRQALHGIGDVASIASLPKVEALLNDQALRGEAIRAYAAIAGSLAAGGDKPSAIRMLEKALEMGPDRGLAGDIVRRLRDLGVKTDPARAAGYVTCWWIVGPFPDDRIDRNWPPQKEVKLDGTVDADGKPLKWQKHHTADFQGVVNLIPLMSPSQNVSAYLYAEITVEKDQDVTFKTGSDDQIKVWLNGEAIFKFPNPRSLKVDDDTFPGKVKAGKNQLLVKIVNGGGGWDGCLRILDGEGKPLKFEQKEE